MKTLDEIFTQNLSSNYNLAGDAIEYLLPSLDNIERIQGYLYFSGINDFTEKEIENLKNYIYEANYLTEEEAKDLDPNQGIRVDIKELSDLLPNTLCINANDNFYFYLNGKNIFHLDQDGSSFSFTLEDGLKLEYINGNSNLDGELLNRFKDSFDILSRLTRRSRWVINDLERKLI